VVTPALLEAENQMCKGAVETEVNLPDTPFQLAPSQIYNSKHNS